MLDSASRQVFHQLIEGGDQRGPFDPPAQHSIVRAYPVLDQASKAFFSEAGGGGGGGWF